MTTTEESALRIIEKAGAVRKGHFLTKKGYCTDTYIDHSAILQDTKGAKLLAQFLAGRFIYREDAIDVVVGPQDGGAFLAQLVAHELGYQLYGTGNKSVSWVFVSKTADGRFMIKDRFLVDVKERRVLVVDDVVSSGYSLNAVAMLMHKARGIIIGAGVLWNRGGVEQKDLLLFKKFEALVTIPIPMWDASQNECSLCNTNVPWDIIFGHGAEYIATKAQQRDRLFAMITENTV